MTNKNKEKKDKIKRHDDADADGKPDAPPKPQYDPDGTLQVARGNISLQGDDENKKLELLRQRAAGLPTLFYNTTQTQLAEERLQSMQADDLDVEHNKANLTDHQRRALEKRQRNQQIQNADGAAADSTAKPASSKYNKQTSARLQRHETKRLQAAVAAHDASIIFQDTVGYLQAEHDMERTASLKQVYLKRQLDTESAKNIYELQLPSPHGLVYDRSGRYSILYDAASSSRGHVAVMDQHYRTVLSEWNLPNQRLRDACFLHNYTLLALAQSQHVYIYDATTGAEIHCLRDHVDPQHLQFLPHHWLLASMGRAGYLKYQDTSTGQLVSQHSTMKQNGATLSLCQNPSNATLVAGHANGSITLWSPASSTYLAKMLCHPGGGVLACVVDPTGHTLVTSGAADRQVSIWDLRMMQRRHSYYTKSRSVATSLDISQRGLLAVGHAGHVTVWGAEALQQKVHEPYMHHMIPGGSPIETVRFRPFQDVCGIGHHKGISSIVIPGAGEATIDTMEYNLNPMQDVKQRQEQEVRALMDKLRPEMIGIDADLVGGMEESDPHRRLERIQQMQEDANAKQTPVKKQKAKKRGRSKIQTKLRRKQANIVDQNILQLRQAREKEKAATAAAASGGTVEPEMSRKESAPSALKRFF